MSVIKHIRNYYEQLVSDEIRYRLKEEHLYTDDDFITDIACVALNRLPTRYIRYEVDMAFYLTQDELLDTRKRVAHAVSEAFKFVEQHRRQESDEEM